MKINKNELIKKLNDELNYLEQLAKYVQEDMNEDDKKYYGDIFESIAYIKTIIYCFNIMNDDDIIQYIINMVVKTIQNDTYTRINDIVKIMVKNIMIGE